MMKYLMFSLFFISSLLLYGQEINMELTFDWPNNTQDDDAFIEEFIASTPNDFQQYKLNERYTPTLSDLFEALHVIDLNNDGLKDVIFDGLSGGEPRRSEEHTSELQSRPHLVCRLLLEKKK